MYMYVMGWVKVVKGGGGAGGGLGDLLPFYQSLPVVLPSVAEGVAPLVGVGGWPGQWRSCSCPSRERECRNWSAH